MVKVKNIDNRISGLIFIGISLFLGIGIGIEHHSILGGFIVGGICLFFLGVIWAMGQLGQ